MELSVVVNYWGNNQGCFIFLAAPDKTDPVVHMLDPVQPESLNQSFLFFKIILIF